MLDVISQLTTTIGTLKVLTDGTIAIRDETKLAEQKSKFLSVIIDIQQLVFELQKESDSMRAEIVQLKQELSDANLAAANANKYVLQEYASGLYCYVTDEQVDGSVEPRRLCADCFDAGKKTTLGVEPQFKTVQTRGSNGRLRYHRERVEHQFVVTCPTCKLSKVGVKVIR